jgi:crossover junction endodeoxyribonuclease RuvC
MAQAQPRIIGIDPGTRNVGYGVIEVRSRALVRLASGCISPSAGTLQERLVAIFRELREVMEFHRPGSAAVETVFAGRNPRTAIAIGEARGVALLAAAERGLNAKGYEPALVKRAVAGSGRADKEQVRRMVQVLLSLVEPPATDHEADALAVAITHARHLEFPETVGRGAAVHGRLPRRGPLPEMVARQLPPSFVPGRKRNRA